MRTLTKLSALAILATGAIACGGDGGEVEQRECGPGTVLVDGQCEVDESNCGEGSVLNAEGQCEPTADICGENTTYDTAQRRCVPNVGIQCSVGTVLVDGQCLPENTIACDEGTVVANNQCVPADDICGEGTETDSQDRCRPSSTVCGEGTAFDVATRTCVPTSELSCGSGTVLDNGTCRLRSTIVAELADTATLNLDENDGEPVDLVSGQPLVFTGNIDAPQLVEGDYLQDIDTLRINGAPGQWIRVAIHANGVPEPGFAFMKEEAESADPEAEAPAASFVRFSDLGGGLDFSREIIIPAEGVYTLDIGPLAQLLELAGPAGGDDWGYVGSVELIDAPAPIETELNTSISGDVRNLTENFYAISNAQTEDSYLINADFGADAMAEIQIWSDAQTLVETISVNGSSFNLSAPAENFFLVVDRIVSLGPDAAYAFNDVFERMVAYNETSAPAIAIPDNNATGISDTIEIDNCGLVFELSIDVNITHTFRGDLNVKLINPDGVEVMLHARTGGGADDVIGNYPTDLTPAGDLGELMDVSGTGTWTLNVSDNAGSDFGTLNSWALNLVCAS